MRFLIALAALIALVATSASAQPTPATGEAVFVLSGGGWGHGVGMPQYGAYGQANEGRTHQQILSYYYSGTQLGTASSRWMRVLLAEGRPYVTINSPGPFTAQAASGKGQKLPKGDIRVGGTTLGRRLKKVKSPVITFRPGKAGPLSLDGNAYRGRFEAHFKGGRVSLINVIKLDEYLQGVVANEMPFQWPEEALEAQAVAARTYALSQIAKGKTYHLVSDTRDQVYRGIRGETDRTNAAVKATASKVIQYGGRLITAYYYSSSGGRTANSADVFGSPVPYLVSKPDPWDRHSPHHKWAVDLDDTALAAKAGVAGRAIDAVASPTPSGRVRALTVQTLAGAKEIAGGDIRDVFGLRSTYLTVTVLRLDKPKSTVVAGSSVALTGVARGPATPMLTTSLDGTSWGKVGPVPRTATGAFSIEVAPKKTRRYRLEVDGAVTPAVLVQVKPAA